KEPSNSESQQSLNVKYQPKSRKPRPRVTSTPNEGNKKPYCFLLVFGKKPNGTVINLKGIPCTTKCGHEAMTCFEVINPLGIAIPKCVCGKGKSQVLYIAFCMDISSYKFLRSTRA